MFYSITGKVILTEPGTIVIETPGESDTASR